MRNILSLRNNISGTPIIIESKWRPEMKINVFLTIYYTILAQLTVTSTKKNTKRRRTKSLGIFEAERLIAQRKNDEGNMYLVRWKGYSSFDSTWEPEEHIFTPLLRYFENPTPPKEVVQEYVDKIRREVLDALRHKVPEQRITCEFRHDVFKYLFGGRGERCQGEKIWTFYHEPDFFRCLFPGNWNFICDKHGDGAKMRFPVKMRTFLVESPKTYNNIGGNIVEMPRAHTEKMSMKFVRVTTTCRN